MKILHCVEFYHPSRGGAQAVVRQISKRLAARGHDVTVATTRLPDRNESELDGVAIEEFKISGNTTYGIKGEADRYRSYVRDGGFDLVMTYAAQQWTTDALLPVLEEIPAKKVLAPCGFSGLRFPEFGEYFGELPDRLAAFDSLIFHSSTYQDIAFARDAGLTNLEVIANGADADEFGELDGDFRARHEIADDEPLLLTVGTHTHVKGHRQAIEGFRDSDIGRGTLVIMGNRILGGCQWECRANGAVTRIGSKGRKRVMVLDRPRAEVLQAYAAADIFVFGSEVECSPLVLFEAAASGTPFVSSDCGNAREIAAWTGAGVVVDSFRVSKGLIEVDPREFPRAIGNLWADAERRGRMAEDGRASWREQFTWDRITDRYEELYEQLTMQAGTRP